MDVKQAFGGVDEGQQLPRATQFNRVARTEERGIGPDSVVVLVDQTRWERVGRVEAREGCDVGKGQSQTAAPRAKALLQQPVERDRAADLVAMRERLHHHPRAGLA